MNKLIDAARKIEALSIKKEKKTKAWQQLARDARKPSADRKEIDRRKSELDSTVVVDFSSAIEELIEALKDIK